MVHRLRVGVDATLLRARGKGVSRFLFQFLAAAAATPGLPIDFVVFVDAAADLPSLPQHDRITYMPVHITKGLAWDLWGFRRALRRTRADMAFTLADRVCVDVPYVLYVFEVPDYRAAVSDKNARIYQRLADLATRWMFPRSARRAAQIAVSSAFTGEDLRCRYHVRPEKITLIYPAPAPEFQPARNQCARERVRAKYEAPDGYLLHFSSRNDPRDNTGRVLSAFAKTVQETGHRKRLVIAGVDRLTAFGWNALQCQPGLEGRITFAGFQIGEELVELYQAADAYVDPSLYEGFGFQVAEAMACGIPVICSNTTSLPELVGDAALLVDPLDVAQLADAIRTVVSDPDAAAVMKQRGQLRIERFTWRRTVEALLDLIVHSNVR